MQSANAAKAVRFRRVMVGQRIAMLSAAIGALTLSVSPAMAAIYTWDVNQAASGTGGTGAWSGSFWTTDGTNYVTWPGATHTAQFGGTAGTVTAGTQSASGLTFNVGGYTLDNGTLTLASGSQISTNGGTTTLSGTLGLAGTVTNALTKTGPGTLAMSRNNTGSLGTAAAPTVWTITGGTFSGGTFDSILSIGAGNNLGAAPTNATTQIILDAGTMRVTGTNLAPAIGATRTIQVNAAGGAIVDSTGNPYQSAVVNNAGAASSLYLSNANGTTTFSNTISGNGSVTWNGAGTLLLSGTNSYAGGTRINSGTVRADQATSSLGSGVAVISGTGTLAGTGSTGGAVALGAVTVGGISSTGGTITAGSGSTATSTAGTLSTAAQTWGSGGKFVAKFKTATNGGNALANGTNWDRLVMSTLNVTATSASKFEINLLNASAGGSLSLLAGQQFSIAHFDAAVSPTVLDAFTLSLNGISVSDNTQPYLTFGSSGGTELFVATDMAPVPEPTTAAMLGLGISGLLMTRRRRAERDEVSGSSLETPVSH